MILERTEQNPGANLLFLMACVVVVVFGLRAAAPILVPATLALFLAVLSLPIMTRLRRWRVPSLLAVILPVLLNIAVVGLLLLLASQSFSQFETSLPTYVERLQEVQTRWYQAIEARTGFVVSEYITTDMIDPVAVVDFMRSAVGRVAQFVSMTVLVFIIMAFMLSEASVFPRKFHHILGNAVRDERRLAKFVIEIQTYLGIKTAISLATGASVGAWCYALNLDFPVLLGMVAFVLNYVPTVGSIIATIPAILMSLILVGTLGHALLVTLGYFVVNMLLGNILDPSLMGRRLNLSTLVVILSLLFWGWAWGPVGALLSVPLTVVMKIWFENTRDLRWVAILLGKDAPPEPVVEPVAAPPMAVETAS